GTGFVVVAGDDAATPILGYSFDTEAPSVDNLPCNVEYWYEAIDNYITGLRSDGVTATEETERQWINTQQGNNQQGNVVVLLETASWSQYEPYYLQCPQDGNSYCLTGCAPTATSIAMRYHTWPIRGTGATKEYETGNVTVASRNLEEHIYDWDNMLLQYTRNYSTTEANAVAELIADVGAAFRATYTTSVTGVQSGAWTNKQLHDHFGYSSTIDWASWDTCESDDEWYDLLKGELEADRPLIYRGVTSSNSAHEFIVDGYTDNNYFHINYGWGGQNDGYYLLPNITYNSAQRALVNFKPAEEGEDDMNPVKEEFENTIVKVGTQISKVANITEGQWYMPLSLNSSYDLCYMADFNALYETDGTDDIVTSGSTLGTNIMEYVVRFIPTGTSNTYYMQYGTGRYVKIPNVESELIHTTYDIEEATPIYTYNIKNTSGHFGFYSTEGSRYRIYAGWGPRYNIVTWNSGVSTSVNGSNDFALYPVELQLLDDHNIALLDCQNAYNKYKSYVGTFMTGTGVGCYDAEAVAAFELAVEAASVCLDDDMASNLSIEELNQLSQDMEDAYNALLETEITTVESIADGYYYIYLAGYDYSIDAAIYLYSHYNTNYVKWGAVEADPTFLWQITDKGDGAYEVMNTSNNAIFNDFVADSYATLSTNSESLLSFDYAKTSSEGDNLFYVRTSTDTEGTYMWAASTNSGEGTSGWVWAGNVTSKDAYWQFVKVSREEAKEILGSEYYDPDELREVLAEAQALLEEKVAGTNPGTWNESLTTALEATIEEATAYEAAGDYTAETLNAYVDSLHSCMEALEESEPNTVQTDKWYGIRSAADGTVLQGSALKESLTFQKNESDEFSDAEKFRFIAVDDAYMMQHKASGLFLRAMGAENTDVVLDAHPTLFNVSALGYGENLISAATLDGESQGNLGAQDNTLVTTEENEAGTAAGLYIEATDEAVASDYDGTAFQMEVTTGAINTLCYPVALTATDGTMYEVEIDGNTVILSQIEGNAASAGQPVIYIYGELTDYDAANPTVATANFTHGYDLEREAQTVGQLTGSYYGGTVGAGKAVAEGNGFIVTSSDDDTIGTNSAYIDGLDGISEITVAMEGEETDGISETVAAATLEGNIYSIDGKLIGKGNLKKVHSLASGVYIVNGVKVVVK
ncbi:MAG: C10 family peptidase, partial [Prevotellaceae bacterium]|nr:C10 family peptidase [Prevotellaceae bacterium]